MSSRFRSWRPSHATVVAYLALFAALSGSAYAAVKITGKNVADGSLTGKDVRDRSLLARDFKRGQLPAGAQGQKGDTGATGATGAQGPAGQNGADGQDGVDGQDGAPGSAAAYLHMDANGVVDASRSKNVYGTSHPSVGTYCIRFTPLDVENFTATLAGATHSSTTAGEIEVGNPQSCEVPSPNGATSAQVVVKTANSAGVLTDKAFQIAAN
jgi:hypothetical protein